MSESSDKKTAYKFPKIIQGGMGVGVSNWRLAKSVAASGQIGVVSGTALDAVLIRRLQDGDYDGSLRRALTAFPYPNMVEPILKKWFQPKGRKRSEPYRLKSMPTVLMNREDEQLLIVANFAEVYLAKEGHDGLVGINFLEKIQLPTLPSFFGAMLAGVDIVIMGGGIPLAIPAVLDEMSKLKPVELKLNLVGAEKSRVHEISFHPGTYVSVTESPLKRPLFFAVVSSDVLAKTLVRKGSGRVDGFVVEHCSAGGHNAPPRRNGAYGARDICNVASVATLGLPFWLAGGCASPQSLQFAKEVGAQGIQVGSAFACSEESGITSEIKVEVIERYKQGEFKVVTDFQASPTGYPFKRAELSHGCVPPSRRVCDLGYLRHVYEKKDGSLSYRCPSGPKKGYLSKGGTEEESEGKQCLCNGLLSTIGLGQVRNGEPLPPLVTLGEDMSFLDALVKEDSIQYSAQNVIDYLLSGR